MSELWRMRLGLQSVFFYLLSTCSVGTPGSEGACTHQQEASADNMHIFDRAPSAYRSDLPPPPQTHARHAPRLLQMSMCACPCARSDRLMQVRLSCCCCFGFVQSFIDQVKRRGLVTACVTAPQVKLRLHSSESQRLKVSRFPRVSVSLK